MIAEFPSLIAVAVVGSLMLASLVLVLLAVLKRVRGTLAPAVPPVPTSLSFLAGFSFFSGLAALMLVVWSAILLSILSMGQVLQVDSDIAEAITLAAKVILYVSLLPAVAAVAFALAARGGISESGGSMRGRPLYRTGVLMAVLSGAVVLDVRVLNPTTWASVLRVERKEAARGRENRGYLGVEMGPLESAAPVSPIRRVVPGSPADRAGLKAGDVVVKVDGTNVNQLPPLGRANDSSWSPGSTEPYLGSYVATLKPGARVAIQVRRGKEAVNVVAELSTSFESLLELLQDQSFDPERLAVLKAAGLDRRYSADELLKICRTFDFDDGRVKAIEPALPILQDPQNAFRILGGLEFSDAKARVSGWITERSKPSKAPKDE